MTSSCITDFSCIPDFFKHQWLLPAFLTSSCINDFFLHLWHIPASLTYSCITNFFIPWSSRFVLLVLALAFCGLFFLPSSTFFSSAPSSSPYTACVPSYFVQYFHCRPPHPRSLFLPTSMLHPSNTPSSIARSCLSPLSSATAFCLISAERIVKGSTDLATSLSLPLGMQNKYHACIHYIRRD